MHARVGVNARPGRAVAGTLPGMAPVGCAFCDIVDGRAAAHLVLDEPTVVAFLDRRPLFVGHVLVVPREHLVTLPDLSEQLLGQVMGAAQRVARVLPAVHDAQGTFVAINNVVSQSVPHLHVHVVPRTRGDGLRGFFWPRTKYSDEVEADAIAARIRAALAEEQ